MDKHVYFTLDEFVSHIKHKSLGLTIVRYETNQVLYKEDIGCYMTSIFKQKFGSKQIVYLVPIDNAFNVYITLGEL